MPNNVENCVEITGDRKILREIKKLLKGENGDIDFNKIIPMPKELMGLVSGFCTIDGQKCSLWREIAGKSFAVSDAEIKAMTEAYGASNWYDWSNKNWGTKWNAYGQNKSSLRGDSLHLDFDTAWDSPRPVFEALHQKFPMVNIAVAVGGEIDENYTYEIRPHERSQMEINL